MSGRRPRRGGGGSRDRQGGNILETGDEGQYEYQGGAGDGASAEGDAGAREFGVPQADLPGGVRHIVNPQSVPVRTEGYPERPADYHKYHGVPSDDGPYETPDTGAYAPPRPVPVPKTEDAVPVYIVEAGEKRVTRDTASQTITINAQTSEPTRICSYDPNRVEVLLMNEGLRPDGSTSTADVRVSESRATVEEDRGARLTNGMTSYVRFRTQGELWGRSWNSAGNGGQIKLSVILVTEVPEGSEGT